MEAAERFIDRWVNKEVVVHIYNRILFSHKKEWNIAIWSTMDGFRDDHTKWSKSEKDKYDITYMWNLKNNPNELIYKTDTGNKFTVLPKGKGREREKPG